MAKPGYIFLLFLGTETLLKALIIVQYTVIQHQKHGKQ